MSTQTRKYQLKARAKGQAETRRRIAAATAELHEEVGPARTTIAEIARRAGVQRLTVYNNFPDESDLFAACQAHFLERNPPPDPSGAFAITDPGERLQAVLTELYAWYRRTERTSANVRRDRASIPPLDALMAATADVRAAALADALAAGFAAGPRPRADRASGRGARARLLDLEASRQRGHRRRCRRRPDDRRRSRRGRVVGRAPRSAI